jgi:hypothetical protein
LRVEHKSDATRTLVVRVEARNQESVLVMQGRGTVMALELASSELTAYSTRRV